MFPFPGRWNQWQKEGFRTRAAHWLLNLAADNRVRKVILVDQPEVSVKSQIKIRKENEKIIVVERYSMISRKIMPLQKIPQSIWSDLKLDSESTVVFVGNPIEMKNAIDVPHAKLIFDCVDDLSVHPQYQYIHYKKLIASGYSLVEKHADIVTAVSSSLIKKFPTKKVNVIRNAVSNDFIKEVEIHNDTSPIQAICYFGIIQNRVNLDLLSKVQKETDVPVQIWGKVWRQNTEGLKARYKNLDFKGEYHYSELPNLLKNAKVLVIPHYVNEFSDSMDPLKLYEYLTTGKPIVSTNILSVKGLDHIVNIAQDDESFIKMVKKALVENDLVKAKTRKEFALSNSWKNRVTQLFSLFEE